MTGIDLTEVPPKISCPECYSTNINHDSEGGCICENHHKFIDTNTWEYRTLRRAQIAERAALDFAEILGQFARLAHVFDGPVPAGGSPLYAVREEILKAKEVLRKYPSLYYEAEPTGATE